MADHINTNTQPNPMKNFIRRTRFRFIQSAKRGETFRSVIYEQAGRKRENMNWNNRVSDTVGTLQSIHDNSGNLTITHQESLRNSKDPFIGCRIVGESFIENGIPGVLIQVFEGDQVTVEKYWFEKDRMMVNNRGELITKEDDLYIRLTFNLN